MYGEVSKRAQMHEAKHVPSRQMHDDRELRPRRSSALPDSASLATTNLGGSTTMSFQCNSLCVFPFSYFYRCTDSFAMPF